MKRMYSESDIYAANSYRKDYLIGVQSFTDELAAHNYNERAARITPENFSENCEYYRKQLSDMLGYPLNAYEYGVPNAEKTFVGSDDYCDIYRLCINTTGKLKFYGILTLPRAKAERYPLLIAQHGGGGTPELLCDMHGDNNYSHISKIGSENGFAVFAPQLLLWNFNVGDRISYGQELNFDRGRLNTYLCQNGSSIVALEIYNLRKAVDYLESLDFIDETKIGMIGLSYGGFYTLYTAALEKRIKAAYSCAAFNDLNRQGCFDWHFCNSNRILQDAEVAALCAPRALFMDVGKNDEVFDAEPAIAEAQRAEALYKACKGNGIFGFNLWEGGHRIDVNGPYLNEFFNIIKE